MYVKGTSVSEVRGDSPDRALQPRRRRRSSSSAVRSGATPQWVLWARPALCSGSRRWLTSVEGFVISPSALRRAPRARGDRRARRVDRRHRRGRRRARARRSGSCSSRFSSLALSAALWWMYFSDEGDGRARDERRAARAAPAARADRLRVLALRAPARGRRARGRTEEGGRRSVRPTRRVDRVELAAGVALFIACDVGFRRTLGIRRGGRGSSRPSRRSRRSPSAPSWPPRPSIGALAIVSAAVLVAEARAGGT